MSLVNLAKVNLPHDEKRVLLQPLNIRFHRTTQTHFAGRVHVLREPTRHNSRIARADHFGDVHSRWTAPQPQRELSRVIA
jgi:hypothetical protein